MSTTVAVPNDHPGVVVFDYPTWANSYPQLSPSVDEVFAQILFNAVCDGLLDNTPMSRVKDATQPGGQREFLLYLLVAHLAKLFGTINGTPPSDLVGRISSASKGSVSVTSEFPQSANAMEAWFMQTQYGAMFWVATMQFRTFQYAPGPQPYFGTSYGSGWRQPW